MDPLHAKVIADVEGQIAEFLDGLAHDFTENHFSAQEIDYALRFAAGQLRQKAVELETVR